MRNGMMMPTLVFLEANLTISLRMMNQSLKRTIYSKKPEKYSGSV
jgi:hypothetical protein